MGLNIKQETLDKVLSSLKEKNERIEKHGKNSSILVVDGMNTFIRSFTVNPSTNDDGLHIGGIAGFLKSIGYAIRRFDVTRCIIVFDGKGGSKRRRKIYKEYKQGRKAARPVNYNRPDSVEGLEDPDESMRRQLFRLGKYLKTLPVTTMAPDLIEADDAIAYIAKQIYNEPDQEVIIMSSDKDFLQIADDRIKVWAPTKKKLYDGDLVYEEYGIPSQNFIIKRLIEGDKSDNIPGVYGIGEKTIKKKLGEFINREDLQNVDDLLEYADGLKETSNTYKRILDNEDVLYRNWDLMQLHDVNISIQKKTEIMEIVKEDISKLDKAEFTKMFMSDKMWGTFSSVNGWLSSTFLKLHSFGIDE